MKHSDANSFQHIQKWMYSNIFHFSEAFRGIVCRTVFSISRKQQRCEKWRSSLEAVPMLLVRCLPHHTLGWRIRNWHIAAVHYLEHSCCTVKKKNKCSMSSLEFNPSIGASTSLVCNQKSKTVTRHSLLEGKTHSKEMMRYM